MKEIICLNKGWRIRQYQTDDKGEWLNADMPAQVHDVLLSNGQLSDPRELYGSPKCQWVADNDWEYQLNFDFTQSLKGSQKLVFEGVDTIADIILNDELITKHCDQYLPAVIDVTGKLKEKNIITIRFYSPNSYIENHPLPERYNGRVPKIRTLRKGEHDFSNYLGAAPKFTKIGLYGDIKLILYDIAQITEMEIKTELKDGYTQAFISAELTTKGSDIPLYAIFALTAPDGSIIAEKTIYQSLNTENNDFFKWSFTVENPLLWWPRGYGDQPIYSMSAKLLSERDEVLDCCVKNFGIRDLDVDIPFNFKINGVQVKLWGANFTPVNGLTHVYDSLRVNTILDLVEIGSMNALRIWGGGEKYEDEFYDEADRRGILIWQDFTNEYGMHPDTHEYRNLCRLEAEYLVKRLRHHPSIILWCGGNENYMGRDFSYPDEDYIGREIFHYDYREVLAGLDPHRPYIESSPFGGAYSNDPLFGDTHSYTNTWFVPGAEYPVFVSENLRVSLPSVKSLTRYVGKENLWPNDYDGRITHKNKDPWPDVWNNVTSAASWRKIPPIENYYDPVNVEELVYNFGWAHGEYLRKTVESYRRGKSWRNPFDERKCMGHLIWKLFATWPHIYGNVLDYYLEPGIAFYALKRTYSPLLLSFEVSDFIFVWLTNDTPYNFEGNVCICLFDPLNNAVKKEMRVWTRVKAGKSEVIININEFGQFDRQNLLYAYIKKENCSWQGISCEGFDGLIARSIDYADIERHLSFPDAKISMELSGDILLLQTDKFARSIELSGDENNDEFGWYFEDNYFDLIPGEIKHVKIFGKHKMGIIRAKSAYMNNSVEVYYDIK